MKIMIKVGFLLGMYWLATSAMAAAHCPKDYCPATDKVFTQSGLIQFIMPVGGKDDPYAPTPEEFNQEFASNNLTYDSFLPGSISFSVTGYIKPTSCQCNYFFKGAMPDVVMSSQVTIDYISPTGKHIAHAK